MKFNPFYDIILKVLKGFCNEKEKGACMVSYNLTETDIEDIEMLIRITKTIDSLYCQLYELEIYGLKDTPEYKKVLDNLNISLEVENNKYQELDLTYERCEVYKRY